MLSIAVPIYKSHSHSSTFRENGDPNKYTLQPLNPPVKTERIQLDQILKLLFRLSDKLTLHMINYLFDKHFSIENVSIHYNDPELIDDELERRIGDLFIMVKTATDEFHYHIEFQLKNDSAMIIRMFRYGFEEALNRAQKNELGTEIEFSDQRVIYLEENPEIGDELALNIRFADNTRVTYRVPVIKYWDYSIEELKQHKMYGLMPLQVFKFRKYIEAIKSSQKTDTIKSNLITQQFMQLKDTIQQLVQTLDQLHSDKEIHNDALGKMLDVIGNITDYLYKKYGEYELIEEEAFQMLKTVFDPKVWEDGVEKGIEQGVEKGYEQGIEKGIEQGVMQSKLEIAKKLLNQHMPIEMISEVTGLTHEEITNLV